MRLPRITTRRLMVLVAVGALLLCVVRLGRQRADYERRAAIHAAREARLWEAERKAKLLERPTGIDLGAASFGKEARHHAALRRTYERAARYPWLPVPPDPPPPE